MNLTLLDRAQLEAIVLQPPAMEAAPLVCSDNAALDYFPPPATARQSQLRHVMAAAHELLTRIAADAVRGRSAIESPTLMKDFFRVYFAGCERESFVVLYLDARHCVIAAEELFVGTVTETRVYPREVVKRTLHFNAAAVCLGHCHPSSGDPSPSRADEHLTATLKAALALIDVRVIDHVVVASFGGQCATFAERGVL